MRFPNHYRVRSVIPASTAESFYISSNLHVVSSGRRLFGLTFPQNYRPPSKGVERSEVTLIPKRIALCRDSGILISGAVYFRLIRLMLSLR